MNIFKKGIERKYDETHPNYVLTICCAYFLGFFGVHHFINGKNILGILRLVLTFSAIFFIPIGQILFAFLMIFATFIWNIVDIVIIYKGKYKDNNGEVIGYEGASDTISTNNVVIMYVIVHAFGYLFNQLVMKI